MILMLAMLAAFIIAIGYVKYEQIQAAIAQAGSFSPPPEAVTTVVAQAEPWDQSLAAIGSMTAVQGVTVSADLPGIVESIHFESGKPVNAGDVLVRLDTRQETAQLRAVEAELELAHTRLARVRELRGKGVTSQAELDDAEAAETTAEARVGEIRATIDRKTIRAPFAGILGIRQVNLGQFLNAGDPVVPLQVLRPIYVDFSVPQQDVDHVQPGTEVTVTAAGTEPYTESGAVTAVDSVVDEATRNVRVQATLRNRDGRLRPGMFVETKILTGGTQTVVPIPASSINYAPYGDSVFIVEEMTGPDGSTYTGVRQQFVKLGPGRGDQIAVISGVNPGDQVVTSGVFKLRNGAAVQVNNEVQPSNDPAPSPEES